MRLGYFSLALDRMDYVVDIHNLLQVNVQNRNVLEKRLSTLSVDLVQVFELYYKAVLVKIFNLDYNATETDIKDGQIRDTYKRIAIKQLLKTHRLILLENSVPNEYKIFRENKDLLYDVKTVYFDNRYKANIELKMLDFSEYFNLFMRIKRNIITLYSEDFKANRVKKVKSFS